MFTNQWICVFKGMNKISLDRKLTEVQAHADENYQAKPGVEVGDKVNDGNGNISDGGEDAEHYVTGRQRRSNRSNSLSSSIIMRSVQENDVIQIKEWWYKMLGVAGPVYQLSALEPTLAMTNSYLLQDFAIFFLWNENHTVIVPNHLFPPDLSKLLMEEVPRSMLRSTSPVLRPRCQRRESECRWEKRRTWTTRSVYCCTRIHTKERKLLIKPEEPGKWRNSRMLWRHFNAKIFLHTVC